MDDPTGLAAQGPFEARYVAFLETISSLRPALHRYCSRMSGSIMDGEDVVQEALFQAYRKLETFDDSRPLKPWLFQIAHNRCIDFLRRREVRQEAEAAAIEPDTVDPSEPIGPMLDRAVEHLVLALPPKERACVLLKDVFDYSLEEIADLVDLRWEASRPRSTEAGQNWRRCLSHPRILALRTLSCLAFSTSMLSGSIGGIGMGSVN
jgi:RNA polymerase sigma-70 factor (ECF subfamily)